MSRFPDPFAEHLADIWAGHLRGEYDRDYDRIVCEHCAWYAVGGPTGTAWEYHDHLVADHRSVR